MRQPWAQWRCPGDNDVLRRDWSGFKLILLVGRIMVDFLVKKTPCFCHGLEIIGAMLMPDGSLANLGETWRKVWRGYWKSPPYFLPCFFDLGINTLSNRHQTLSNIATKPSFLEIGAAARGSMRSSKLIPLAPHLLLLSRHCLQRQQ
jgi:hypothetical protein